MPNIVDSVEVDVDETYVNVGRVEREVTMYVTVEEFLEECGEAEHKDVLEWYDDDSIQNEYERRELGGSPRAKPIDYDDLHSTFRNATPAQLDKVRAFLNPPVPEGRQPQIVSLSLSWIDLLFTVGQLPPEQFAALPEAVLEGLNKQLNALPQIVRNEVPADLRELIQAMQPGEVEQSFINELKLLAH